MQETDGMGVLVTWLSWRRVERDAWGRRALVSYASLVLVRGVAGRQLINVLGDGVAGASVLCFSSRFLFFGVLGASNAWSSATFVPLFFN